MIGKVDDRHRYARDALLMLHLAVVLAVVGLWFMPPADVPLDHPGELVLEAPADVKGEDGEPNPIVALGVLEAGSKDEDFILEQLFGQPSESDPGAPILGIYFALEHPTTAPTSVELRLDLPDGVDADCAGSISGATCDSRPNPLAGTPGRSDHMLVINFSLPQTEQTLMSWTYASGGGPSSSLLVRPGWSTRPTASALPYDNRGCSPIRVTNLQFLSYLICGISNFPTRSRYSPKCCSTGPQRCAGNQTPSLVVPNSPSPLPSKGLSSLPSRRPSQQPGHIRTIAINWVHRQR